MRTSVRVTAQGRPYARLKRALATGNPNIALAAAAELPRVDLADALALCLLLCDDGERYERAIVRWHARFCLEVPGVGASEAQLALAALRSTARPEYEAGARALIALLERHGLAVAAGAAERWLERRVCWRSAAYCCATGSVCDFARREKRQSAVDSRPP